MALSTCKNCLGSGYVVARETDLVAHRFHEDWSVCGYCLGTGERNVLNFTDSSHLRSQARKPKLELDKIEGEHGGPFGPKNVVTARRDDGSEHLISFLAPASMFRVDRTYTVTWKASDGEHTYIEVPVELCDYSVEEVLVRVDRAHKCKVSL